MENILEKVLQEKYLEEFIRLNLQKKEEGDKGKLVLVKAPLKVCNSLVKVMRDNFNYLVDYYTISDANDESYVRSHLSGILDSYDFLVVDVYENHSDDLEAKEHIEINMTEIGLHVNHKEELPIKYGSLTEVEVKMLRNIKELNLPVVIEGSVPSVISAVTEALVDGDKCKVYNLTQNEVDLFNVQVVEKRADFTVIDNSNEQYLIEQLQIKGALPAIIQSMTNSPYLAETKNSIGNHILIKCYGSLESIYINIKPVINKVTVIPTEDFYTELPLIYIQRESSGLVKYEFLSDNNIKLVELKDANSLTCLVALVEGRIANLKLEGAKNFKDTSMAQLAFHINMDELEKGDHLSLGKLISYIRTCGVMIVMEGSQPYKELPGYLQGFKTYKI